MKEKNRSTPAGHQGKKNIRTNDSISKDRGLPVNERRASEGYVDACSPRPQRPTQKPDK